MSKNESLSTSEEVNTVFNDMFKAVTSNDVTKIAELIKEPEPKTPEETNKPQDPPVEAKTPEVKPPEEPKAPEVKQPEAAATEVKKPEETQPAAETQPQAQKKDPFEWINNLPDEDSKEEARALLAKYKQSEHDRRTARQAYKSNAGRIAAYQRTVAELKSQLSERPQHDIAASHEKDEDFKALIENDPKFAAYLIKREQAQADRFEKRLESIVKPLIEGQERQADSHAEEFVQEQQQILRQYVPNVDEVIKHPLFQNWVTKEATQGQLALVNSPNWEDGYAALQLYTEWLMREGHVQPPAANAQTASTQQAPAKPAPNAVADKVAASRDRKSNTTASVASSSTASLPVNPGASDVVADPKALFEKYYNEILKQG